MAGVKQPSDKSHFLLPDLGEGLVEPVQFPKSRRTRCPTRRVVRRYRDKQIKPNQS